VEVRANANHQGGLFKPHAVCQNYKNTVELIFHAVLLAFTSKMSNETKPQTFTRDVAESTICSKSTAAFLNWSRIS